MKDSFDSFLSSVLPPTVAVVMGVLLFFKIMAIEEQHHEIIEDIADLRMSLSGEKLADAILAATSDKNKDTKDEKYEKEKKGKKYKKRKKDKKKK
jgi:hypothetical protein